MESKSVQPSERRLGVHHFACLRAVAEGISVKDAAEKYLAVEHALAAPAAYRAVLEQVRAVARRRGDTRWRLLGLQIEDQPGGVGDQPSLHDWADAEGLADWSHVSAP